MRRVDITIEEKSFAELASASESVGISPAEFARRATVAAVRLFKARDAASRDVTGYSTHPVGEDEFAISEQDIMKGDDETW